jgi:tetratricopeptide (TPR) repeat protein
VRDDGSLARLPQSTSVRAAARQAMELIKVASPAETLRRLDELAARFPDSAMPLVHRGELQLWLGNYAEARADLEGAIAVHRQTRWAWYGLACLDLIDGEPARALDTCAAGIAVMYNTEGPAAFLYRGEAYRLLGRLEEARRQLQLSCESNPTRLSAWVNLALAHGAAGDRAAQRQLFQQLVHRAPALLSEAASGLGEEAFRAAVIQGYFDPRGQAPPPEVIDRVLEQVLRMMRGNRSSSCVTYFTEDGQLRHVPQDVTGIHFDGPTEERALARMAQVLRRAIEGR